MPPFMALPSTDSHRRTVCVPRERDRLDDDCYYDNDDEFFTKQMKAILRRDSPTDHYYYYFLRLSFTVTTELRLCTLSLVVQ